MRSWHRNGRPAVHVIAVLGERERYAGNILSLAHEQRYQISVFLNIQLRFIQSDGAMSWKQNVPLHFRGIQSEAIQLV
jgi:hypothetical protein